MTSRRLFALCSVVVLLSVGVQPSFGAPEPLTLRINDATGEPGGRIAVVLRTYAPRSIRQGQLCFHFLSQNLGGAGPVGIVENQAENAAGTGPFATLEEVVIFSRDGDAESQAFFPEPGASTVMVEFASPSGGVNWSDGPLGALFFRLSETVQPGEAFQLDLDGAESWLVDEDGNPVPLELRAGELTVRSPATALDLGAEGGETSPGSPVVLGVSTEEPFPIASGQIGFRYPAGLLPGPPVVRIDPRYGEANLSVDASQPGLLQITLDSPDGTLNWLPGDFLYVALPSSPQAAPGTQAAIWLDPDLTWLEDPTGASLPLELDGDLLTIEALAPGFADGFESGAMSAWTQVISAP